MLQLIKFNIKLELGSLHVTGREGRVVMGTKRMQRDLFTDPLLAETFGVLHVTLIFSAELGLRNIIQEGDALQIF